MYNVGSYPRQELSKVGVAVMGRTAPTVLGVLHVYFSTSSGMRRLASGWQEGSGGDLIQQEALPPGRSLVKWWEILLEVGPLALLLVTVPGWSCSVPIRQLCQ
jgi:hypothetical protein